MSAALTEAADGLWTYVQGDGGWGQSNAGLVVGGDQTLLVDTLYDLRLTDEMLRAMRAAVPAAEEIGTLVNTHANGDHCYGNERVAGARMIASARAAEEMAEVPPALMQALKENAGEMGDLGAFFLECFGPYEFAGIDFRIPEETFAGELELRVGDRRVLLRELGPAHTRGDVIVHLPEARAVLCGDLLFHGRHPVAWAGPPSNWVRGLDHLLGLDVDVVVPGHGAVCDLAAVRELKAYWEWLGDEARELWERGADPLAAARSLALDPRFAGWAERERLVVNLAALFREWSGDDEPPNPVELWGAMAAYARGPAPDAPSPGVG